MNNKATHFGTCQVCGAMQKLPNGKLAKHGYTTRQGFFEGTCIGSGELPLEVSCDMIEASVKAAEKAQAHNLNLCEVWRNEETKFQSYRTTKYGVVWHEVTGVALNETTFSYTTQDAYGKPWKRQEFAPLGSTLAGLVKAKNAKYVNFCAAQAEACERYIADQQQVLKTWTPKELKAVKG